MENDYSRVNQIENDEQPIRRNETEFARLLREEIHREKGEKDKLVDKILAVANFIEDKLFAAGCIMLAAYTIYYTNFVGVILRSESTDWYYLSASLVLYLLCFGYTIYLIIWLRCFKKIEDFEAHSPNAIPIITVCGLAAMVFLVFAIWDIWVWWSILIVISIKLGIVMTAHFSPSGNIGSLVVTTIILAILFSDFVIDHEGYFHENRKTK